MYDRDLAILTSYTFSLEMDPDAVEAVRVILIIQYHCIARNFVKIVLLGKYSKSTSTTTNAYTSAWLSTSVIL